MSTRQRRQNAFVLAGRLLVVAYLDDVRHEKDALLRGLVLIVGGAALMIVGTSIGFQPARWAQITAGVLAVTGITTLFLAVFVYVLPPLLPAK